jgi:hypothetical protein
MVRITVYIGIAKTCPDPFVLLILPIVGEREIFVLDRRVFFKRSLRVQQAQEEHHYSEGSRCERGTEGH